MVAKLEDLAGLPYWPRLLSREHAAAYLGITASTFDAGVEDGTWPEPIRIGRRALWDIRMLDQAVDALSSWTASSGRDDYDERRAAHEKKRRG